MKPLPSLPFSSDSSARRSFESSSKRPDLRRSMDVALGSTLRPQFKHELDELEFNAKECPITTETGAELGHNRFVSVVDKRQVYSAVALAHYLLKSGSERAARQQMPVYLSPLTRKDMQADALRLGLPAMPPAVASGEQQEFDAPISIVKFLPAALGIGVATGIGVGAGGFLAFSHQPVLQAMLGLAGLFSGVIAGGLTALLSVAVAERSQRHREAAAQDIEMNAVNAGQA